VRGKAEERGKAKGREGKDGKREVWKKEPTSKEGRGKSKREEG